MQHGHAAANVLQPPPGLTRRSEFRSAAEVRSRSATRPEPCRSHSAAVMTTMPPNLDSVQMLQQMMQHMMAQQTALLEEQTSMLRQQRIEAACGQQAFQCPEKALESLDPSLRKVMQNWKATFKKDLYTDRAAAEVPKDHSWQCHHEAVPTRSQSSMAMAPRVCGSRFACRGDWWWATQWRSFWFEWSLGVPTQKARVGMPVFHHWASKASSPFLPAKDRSSQGSPTCQWFVRRLESSTRVASQSWSRNASRERMQGIHGFGGSPRSPKDEEQTFWVSGWEEETGRCASRSWNQISVHGPADADCTDWAWKARSGSQQGRRQESKACWFAQVKWVNSTCSQVPWLAQTFRDKAHPGLDVLKDTFCKKPQTNPTSQRSSQRQIAVEKFQGKVPWTLERLQPIRLSTVGSFVYITPFYQGILQRKGQWQWGLAKAKARRRGRTTLTKGKDKEPRPWASETAVVLDSRSLPAEQNTEPEDGARVTGIQTCSQ